MSNDHVLYYHLLKHIRDKNTSNISVPNNTLSELFDMPNDSKSESINLGLYFKTFLFNDRFKCDGVLFRVQKYRYPKLKARGYKFQLICPKCGQDLHIPVTVKQIDYVRCVCNTIIRLESFSKRLRSLQCETCQHRNNAKCIRFNRGIFSMKKYKEQKPCKGYGKEIEDILDSINEVSSDSSAKTNTKSINEDQISTPTKQVQKTNKVQCIECQEGHYVLRKNDKNGDFYGCSCFPLCRSTLPVDAYNLLLKKQKKNPLEENLRTIFFDASYTTDQLLKYMKDNNLEETETGQWVLKNI